MAAPFAVGTTVKLPDTCLPLVHLRLRRPFCSPQQSRGLRPQWRTTTVNRSELRASIASGQQHAGTMQHHGTDEFKQSFRAPQAEAESDQGDKFNWARQWYPVAVADQLDPTRPNKATLLGRSLALWRDPDSVWRAFEDRCPHRLAPFTEGRVEEADGLLSCSYHGWRFDGEGRAQQIPQADDPEAHATAIASKRACATSFPTTVQENMLWVWGEAGAEAFIHSAASTPAVTAELEALPADTRVFRIGKPYSRDLYYDFETLVENFLDPAHVPFAHHSVIGNRYKETSGFCHVRPSPPETEVPNGGFSFDTTLKSFGPKPNTLKIQYHPPSLVRYFTPRDDGGFTTMNLHCVPTGPGRSRVTYSFFSTVENKFTKLGSLMPAWMEHMQRHLVFDGDHALLHIQEQIAAREAQQPGGSWRKSYWMPTESDRIVTAWRQWLDSQGSPTWVPGAPEPPVGEELPKSLLLDRYQQHTKNCPHCLKALRVFKALRVVAAAAAVFCAAAALVSLLTQQLQLTVPALRLPATLAVCAAAAAGAWTKLTAQVEKFYWVDYDHQEKR
mmetsp:Transcript_16078/g.48171  ORF Transcript_16078/g.48171 Transcript_16078/m.48171 type:complete len:558 (+) Transcript_16078:141-1814(+)